VAEKVRDRLPVSKRAVQNFDTEGFNLKKLNNVAVKEHYQVNSHTGLWLQKMWMITCGKI
jgi:hypothetical protein